MKKAFKNIVTFALIMTIFSAKIRAETFELSPREKACMETLNSCDDALNKGSDALNAKDKVISIQKQQVDELTKALTRTEDQKNSLLRNPVIWFFIGLGIGGIAMGAVSH